MKKSDKVNLPKGKKIQSLTINRSAKSGKIVSKAEAKKNPDTTVTEKVKDNKATKAKIQNALNAAYNQIALIESLLEKL